MSTKNSLNLLTAGLGALLRSEVVVTEDKSDRQMLDLNVLHKLSLQWVNSGTGVFASSSPCSALHTLEFDDLNQSVKTKSKAGIPSASLHYQSPDSFPVIVRTLSGGKVKLNCRSSDTINSLKIQVEQSEGTPLDLQRLVFEGKQLEDGRQISDYNILDNSVIHLVQRLRGGYTPIPYCLDRNLLDPRFDFDFTDVRDVTPFSRGCRPYQRPCGWRRYALKVVGKYEDNLWLGMTGTGPKEWPVSYHGTACHNVSNISTSGYDLGKGKRFRFGKGIYSSESPTVAEDFAIEFHHENRKYKVIMQNRYDPARTTMISRVNFLVTSEESAIRPYGILIKECLANSSRHSGSSYGYV